MWKASKKKIKACEFSLVVSIDHICAKFPARRGELSLKIKTEKKDWFYQQEGFLF